MNKISEIEVSYRPAIGRKPIIRSALDAYVELKEFFPKQTIALQEQFVCMYLNRQSRVLGVFHLSKGSISGTVVDIRLLLSLALKVAASSIIIAHNHPSGNTSPSNQDRELTKNIQAACKFLDIDVHDHIILSPFDDYYSMASEGILSSSS